MESYYLMGEERKTTPLDAEQLLRGLSVTGKLIGFRYTVYMIEQAAQDPDRIHLITKCLYPETARRYGTTASAVERALRNVINAVWERTNHRLLEHIAGAVLRRPPTNSEFIDMLAGYLRKHR